MPYNVSCRQFSRSHMPFLTLDEYSGGVKDAVFPLNMVIAANAIFPYFFGILGTMSNLFLILVYITRENKFIHKYYYPLGCLANQIYILAFFASNTANSGHRSLINYSVFYCKMLTYVFHISSSLMSWMFASMSLIMRCYLSNDNAALHKTRKMLHALPVILGVVYSIDILYLDLLNVSKSSDKLIEQKMCGINNPKLAFVSHLIDFLVYFGLPFGFMVVNFVQLRVVALFKLKVTMTTVSIIVCLPVLCVTLLHDYYVLKQSNCECMSPYLFEFYFTIVLILNHSFLSMSTCMNMHFNEHSREMCRAFVCFACLKCKQMKRNFMTSRRNTSAKNVLDTEEAIDLQCSL